MACAFVQDWQAETPAVVEYLPLSQALQAPPSLRNPALQTLDSSKIRYSTPAPKK